MSVIELEPVDYYCPHCDSAMEWTACDAPGCPAYRCLNCPFGCDLNDHPDDGACAIALAKNVSALAGQYYKMRPWRYYRRPLRTVPFPGECS